jgi:hypothetical protein
MAFLHPRYTAAWTEKWKLYIIPVALSAFLLQILLLGNMSYLYGALFKSSSRMSNLKILAVDFGGGDVGQALSAGYKSLESDAFPTVEFGSPSDYQTPDTLRGAVCNHSYWGAVYTTVGASDRALAAIKGDNTKTYDATAAITYIYNGVYHPAVAASVRGSCILLSAPHLSSSPLYRQTPFRRST